MVFLIIPRETYYPRNVADSAYMFLMQYCNNVVHMYVLPNNSNVMLSYIGYKGIKSLISTFFVLWLASYFVAHHYYNVVDFGIGFTAQCWPSDWE